MAVATYGKLDIMFNNAGITDPAKPQIMDNEKTDFERVLSVDVTGVFLGMKHAARVMVPARAGTILTTSSLASRIGGTITHAYTCAKHAVGGLTKNVAVELGQFGIRVNCLSPYAIATPMCTSFLGLDVKTVENMMNAKANLKGVTCETDDVAKAALFLVSEEAKYISGQNLFVDGGVGITNSSFSMFQHPGESFIKLIGEIVLKEDVKAGPGILGRFGYFVRDGTIVVLDTGWALPDNLETVMVTTVQVMQPHFSCHK